MINKSTIQEYRIQGKLDQAIKMFLTLTEKYDSDLYNSAVMLSGRYNSLKNDRMMGTISSENVSLNENRINLSLTHLLNDIDDSWETEGDMPTVEAEQMGDVRKEKVSIEEAKVKTILFLAANPKDTEPLRLDKEMREIDEGLRRSQKRDAFKLVQKWAVQIPDLRRALLDESPSIVHYSGHGSSEGRIILEDVLGSGQEIPSQAIGNLFSLFSDNVECVLLNACYSEDQAQEIAKHISFVIGMNEAIPDKAAIEFSSAFYDAIGNGRDVEFAFKLAKNSIELFGIDAAQIPVLIKK